MPRWNLLSPFHAAEWTRHFGRGVRRCLSGKRVSAHAQNAVAMRGAAPAASVGACLSLVPFFGNAKKGTHSAASTAQKNVGRRCAIHAASPMPTTTSAKHVGHQATWCPANQRSDAEQALMRCEKAGKTAGVVNGQVCFCSCCKCASTGIAPGRMGAS